MRPAVTYRFGIGVKGYSYSTSVDEMRVMIRCSKTDQEGVGAVIGVPTPSSDVRHGLAAALAGGVGIEYGAVFRRVDAQGQVRPGRLAPQSVGVIREPSR
jgi:hypothetical protein